MKKLLCLGLAMIMMLSMVACGGEKGPQFESGVLYAGFGRAVINPQLPTPLGGYDSNDLRMHDRILDDLMATCVALTDGEETFLMISADAVRSKQSWTDAVRQKITQEFGIPGTHVMLMASHSHSAPNTNSQNAVMGAYTNIFVDGCVEAARQALADRAKATMYQGSVMTENMTFVRHYLMNDGSVSGPNFGSASSGYKGHVGRNDPEMILVKLEREGEDKKPILMMNFQAHTTMTGGAEKLDISADYVGICRDYLEENEGVLFAYYLGACGNQTPNSYIPQENNVMPFAGQLPTSDRDYISYGTALGLYAQQLLPNLTKVEHKSGIQTASKVVTLPTDKNQSTERVNDALAVKAAWDAQGRDAGNALARQKGFASVYEANGVLGIDDLPDSNDIEVCATRVGGMYFVNAPYEMFSENALYIKENAPKGTMVITQSNHAWGYITDKKAFEYKCYENFGFNFCAGAGEELAQTMVDLLKTVG